MKYKCKECGEYKDEEDMIYLYHAHQYICKECNEKTHEDQKDDYLEYMYATKGF